MAKKSKKAATGKTAKKSVKKAARKPAKKAVKKSAARKSRTAPKAKKKAVRRKPKTIGDRISSAFNTVVETVTGTEKMRDKMEQRGSSQSE